MKQKCDAFIFFSLLLCSEQLLCCQEEFSAFTFAFYFIKILIHTRELRQFFIYFQFSLQNFFSFDFIFTSIMKKNETQSK